jgi:UDP-2-acetamido-3-amino-2,3-dideoxy-glucuronate N-acetyltransferase
MRPFIHNTSYVEKPSQIGENTKIWHFCHIMTNAKIGDNCILGQNVFIGPNVVIGNNTKIQNNVSIFDGVTCEDNVFIGPSVVFTNVMNPRSFIERKEEFKKTLLEEGCSIGANSTIICGNTVGKFSFVGAGSVVNRDINNFELVVGNPIRNIGWVNLEGEKLNFSKNNTIESNGKTYNLSNNKVKIIK